MDLDLVRHVAVKGFSAMSKLTALLDLLRNHCEPEEYESFRRAIASCAANISIEIIDRALTPHPALEREIEERVQKYGVVV